MWMHVLPFTIIISGQIIATSHDLTSKGSWGREIPLLQGNLGWWNIIIWPDNYNIIVFVLSVAVFFEPCPNCNVHATKACWRKDMLIVIQFIDFSKFSPIQYTSCMKKMTGLIRCPQNTTSPFLCQVLKVFWLVISFFLKQQQHLKMAPDGKIIFKKAANSGQ